MDNTIVPKDKWYRLSSRELRELKRTVQDSVDYTMKLRETKTTFQDRMYLSTYVDQLMDDIHLIDLLLRDKAGRTR